VQHAQLHLPPHERRGQHAPRLLPGLRTIAPKVLATLEPREQEGFLRDMGTELARAEQGQETYDIRPPGEQQPPGGH
jgi:hypothetical protein